ARAPTTRFRRRSDVRSRVVDGEAVVLDRRRQLVHQLNRTATHVWERCDGRHTIAELGGELAEAFDVDRVTASRDAAAILRQLEALGLVEADPEATTVQGE
ncbi:MAG TPA: PqqD family protein, partial [Candidatus Tectomicrobia bacterium]|nr:PqqD family protein [Candidatus Tectomicrobia bacterium]